MTDYDDNFVSYCEQSKYGQIEAVCKCDYINFICIQQGVDVAIRKNDYKMLSIVVFSGNKDLTDKLIKYIIDNRHLEYLKKLIFVIDITHVVYLLLYFINTNHLDMIHFFNHHFTRVEYTKIKDLTLSMFDKKYPLYPHYSKQMNKTNYKILKNAVISLNDINIDNYSNIRTCIDKLLRTNINDTLDDIYIIICNCRYAANHPRAKQSIDKFKEIIIPSLNTYLLGDISNIVVDYIIKIE